MRMVDDINEQLAYLRSSIIGLLVDECSRVFIEYEDAFLNGTFEGALIERIEPQSRKAYEACSAMAYEKYIKPKKCWISN
jgi:dGTPase